MTRGSRRFGQWVALGLGGLGASCAATFDAVDATGKLGQRIDGAPAFGAAAQLCRETQALAVAPLAAGAPAAKAARDCAALEAQGVEWSAVAAALSAYAAKLSELAGRDDPDVEDQVNAALGAASAQQWTRLGEAQNAAIAGLAKEIVKVLSMSYRAGVLDEVIGTMDPHVQRVAALLRGEADLRLHEIEALDKTVSQLIATYTLLPVTPDADQTAVNQLVSQGSGAGLELLRRDLAARQRAY
ncbi:MAG TPA: hypothetical protein VGK73_01395, partial [Polyangiaceae bacterium]